MGAAPPAARVSDPKGIKNERRICVHYLWSGVTIQHLLFPISPFFAFGYCRLATLGPRLDLFENNQGGVHSIKSFMPNYFTLFGKEGMQGRTLSTGS